MTVRRALLSTYDKTGVAAFAEGLQRLGVELLASGGTARCSTDAGLEVIPLEELTGFAEMLGHRVVTLHPAVHGGILARRDMPEDLADLERHGLEPIDLVCVNLYPFEQTIAGLDVSWEEAIEKIDVGGPAMLRAAAKNNADVVAVCRPEDYEPVLAELREPGRSRRRRGACSRLARSRRRRRTTAPIAAWLARDERFPIVFTPVFDRVRELAYGENPHQRAAFYAERGARTHLLARVEQLHGKELSYNNLNDLSAARLLARELAERPACVIVKHANPCGVGVGGTIEEAYAKALAADPVSAYGGVVVLTRAVTAALGRGASGAVRRGSLRARVRRRGARGARPEARHAHPQRSRAARLRAERAGLQARARRAARPGPRPRAGRARGHGRRVRRARRRVWDDLALRLDGRQARDVERDRARARRPDARCRRGTDEPRRRGSDRGREGARARPLARRRRARVRCVLPVRGRAASWRSRPGCARSSSRAARSATTRSSRRSRGRGDDGLHGAPALPALMDPFDLDGAACGVRTRRPRRVGPRPGRNCGHDRRAAEEEAAAAYRRLHAARALVLFPETLDIWMANPFCFGLDPPSGHAAGRMLDRHVRLGRSRHPGGVAHATVSSRASARAAATSSSSKSSAGVSRVERMCSLISWSPRGGGGTTSASRDARWSSSGRRGTCIAGSRRRAYEPGQTFPVTTLARPGDAVVELAARPGVAAAVGRGVAGDPRAPRPRGRVLAARLIERPRREPGGPKVRLPRHGARVSDRPRSRRLDADRAPRQAVPRRPRASCSRSSST